MEQSHSVNTDPEPISHRGCTKWRNWSGFWLLGMCNNFAYVVMLSAAHDILKKQETQNSTAFASVTSEHGNSSSNSSSYDCNPTSTAAVLLADILPTLFIKMLAPFIIHKVPYALRVLCCALAAAASFLVVSFSSTVWMSFFGVVLASIGAGLGELSFLALTVYFSRDVVGAWSSGTGGAGVAGAFLYSGLTQLGFTPQVTLLIMLIVPMAMVLSYFLLLAHPSSLPQWSTRDSRCSELLEETQGLMDSAEEDEDGDEDNRTARAGRRARGPLSNTEKLRVMKSLLKFVLPLGLVYFAEYFINQGLMELLYFPGFSLSHAEQYRWYQALYQGGVFLSRSSLCCFKVRKLWIFTVLQFVNVVLLTLAVWYRFMPSVWIVFGIILYEGLLGGCAYVNTFYFISKETEERYREFAMSLASVGDTLGICLSTALSFPTHKYFCSL
ncbi:battenin [Eucyclogobius newberryi]|uniref:battenin n=1 Tax=Eucyclogobius newberryi TaxID=166745 RepID=UPI003B5A9E80